MKNKQYFYLVAIQRGESETNVVPSKITLQEYEAVKYGRRLTMQLERDSNEGVVGGKVRLYRQSITHNGVIEFVKELSPFREDSRYHFGNYDKSNKDNRYLIHWISERSGMKPELVSGKDEANAMNKAGYGAGVLGAVDWIESLKPEEFIETPCGKIYILKGKRVGGLLQPRRSAYIDVCGNHPYLTGISFMDDTKQYEEYPSETQAQMDWEYLKKVLF